MKQLKAKKKEVHIIAPTNLAALAVNGKTTWNYAGWKPDNMKKPLEELEARAHGKQVWKRFSTTDVLVIDEVSMVENLLFERLNAVMKAARSSGKAFGGVQVVVTGDVCHLAHLKKPILISSVLPTVPCKTFPVLHRLRWDTEAGQRKVSKFVPVQGQEVPPGYLLRYRQVGISKSSMGGENPLSLPRFWDNH